MDKFQITVLSRALEGATTVKQRKELILKVTDEIEDLLNHSYGALLIAAGDYDPIKLNIDFITNLPSKYTHLVPVRIPSILHWINYEHSRTLHNTQP